MNQVLTVAYIHRGVCVNVPTYLSGRIEWKPHTESMSRLLSNVPHAGLSKLLSPENTDPVPPWSLYNKLLSVKKFAELKP